MYLWITKLNKKMPAIAGMDNMLSVWKSSDNEAYIYT